MLQRLRYLVLMLAVFALITVPTAAQSEPPLVGPLVAATDAQQDRIYLYDLGSDSMRTLDVGEGWVNVWGFSPNGCELLYTRTRPDGLARMYTVKLDGSGIREWLQYDALPDSQWGVWEPQWSPDGERIAFTLLRDSFEGETERQYHVGWVSAPTDAPQFYSVTGREHSPQWSPDGTWLAYISYDLRPAGTSIDATAEPTPDPPAEEAAPVALVREADLWVVSADAETKYRLTSFDVGSATRPRWSPDGQLISFVYSPGPANDTLWIIANQAGAIPTQLSFTWHLALATTWLPDSSALVAALRDFREVPENLLWRVSLLGNADETSIRYLDGVDLRSADYPRFSADGRLLALRSAYALTVVDTEDGSILLRDDTHPGNTPPVWSPAGLTSEADCTP